jgi:hypothetical protein
MLDIFVGQIQKIVDERLVLNKQAGLGLAAFSHKVRSEAQGGLSIVRIEAGAISRGDIMEVLMNVRKGI